jgi:hypothetical protein
MINHNTTPRKKLRKDTKKLSEAERFFEFFKANTTTVFACEKALGISRANGCRYKKHFESLGLLKVAKMGRCPITGVDGVQFITTNSALFPKPTQLKFPFNYAR